MLSKYQSLLYTFDGVLSLIHTYLFFVYIYKQERIYLYSQYFCIYSCEQFQRHVSINTFSRSFNHEEYTGQRGRWARKVNSEQERNEMILANACVHHTWHICTYKTQLTRGRLDRLRARARFVPSYNYLQVTYLKGRFAWVYRVVASRARYASVPGFMSFCRGCGFAFNCERDSLQPVRYQLALFKMRTFESTFISEDQPF